MSLHNMHGPGMVLNRHAKRGKIEIAFDPTDGAFVSKCGAANERLKILIIPGDGDMAPIEISASPRAWVFKCESAAVPADRLADLEALITEEASVHVVVEYSPAQDDLPFERATKNEIRDTDSPATEGKGLRMVKERIVVAFKGIKKAGAIIAIQEQDEGGWAIGFDLSLGNWQGGEPIGAAGAFPSRAEALAAARQLIAQMLTDEVPITGTADQKRGHTRRRDMMIEQIAARLIEA